MPCASTNAQTNKQTNTNQEREKMKNFIAFTLLVTSMNTFAGDITDTIGITKPSNEKSKTENAVQGTGVAAAGLYTLTAAGLGLTGGAAVAGFVGGAAAVGFGAGMIIRSGDKLVGEIAGNEEGYLTRGISYIGEESGIFEAIHNFGRSSGKDSDSDSKKKETTTTAGAVNAG
jgi:hypothetical protein